MATILDVIPDYFWTAVYNGDRPPEAGAGLTDGANCQHFAYELIRHFGRRPTDLWSSDLWEDSQSIRVIPPYQPLDLLLFNRAPIAYAAHLAVYVGDDQAMHLAKSVGRPAVWRLATFLERSEYAVLVGAKRFPAA